MQIAYLSFPPLFSLANEAFIEKQSVNSNCKYSHRQEATAPQNLRDLIIFLYHYVIKDHR